MHITDLLVEIDACTGFSDCFNHQRSGHTAEDRPALLAAILAGGISLGLTRTAETCRNVTPSQIIHDIILNGTDRPT